MILKMVTASTFLDLRDLLVNEVAGNTWIFVFMALAMIFFMAAYFRWQNAVAGFMVIIFLVLISLFYPVIGIVMIIAIAALFFGKVIIKAINNR